ncbi:NAD(P)/FAD-dependent oxidoreductase [Nocardioides sp.]|uniref:FAD-dependent oxidoreductase n=1 Tax=Nocardioides sp. TaxID=35761 RepID=UPI00261A530D|nr:NAD(P)/FAD-dependent oxidoreductase [Nocardioides sp.]
MASSRTAEIVGAGLAGLTAATALAQRGWTVRLHERDSEIRAIGAGIYVWGNGLATLEALGLDAAMEGAHVGPALESRDHRNRTIERVPINGPGQARVLTIMRDRLIDTLVRGAQEAGVEIHTGSEVVEAAPDGTVITRSGQTRRADVVLAADGINSRIRRQYDVVERRARMHQGATRLTIPRAPGLVPLADQEKYLEYFSGRRRVLYTPSSATSLYVALVADEDDRAASRLPVDVDSWVRSFPHLEQLLTACGEAEGRWDTFEFLTLTRWSIGRLAFLGDAAHAQPPYLGQGGGCAMMSALGLADTLAGPGPVDQLLRDWEHTQRPVIEHTQRWSYRLRLVNNVPDVARAALLRGADLIPTLGASRLRAARTIPTGVDHFAGAVGS